MSLLPVLGGGGQVLSYVRLSSAAAQIDLTWNVDAENVGVLAWLEGSVSVTSNLTHAYMRLGSESGLDSSSNYEYHVADIAGNQSNTGGTPDTKIHAARLSVPAQLSNPRWGTLQMFIGGANDPSASMYSNFSTWCGSDSGRSSSGWGEWVSPSGPLRRIRLYPDSGNFEENSAAIAFAWKAI